jgi:3-oxoacyl-[acyl-carrier-protein] synthase III
MRILSVHHSVPATRITNDAVLAAIRHRNQHRLSELELDAVERRITDQLALAGTDVRYIAPDGENALDHVLAAGRQALASAGVGPEEVDFVIYTGIGRGWLEPASANVVQHALGLTNATGFDLLDACASWLRALQVAHSFIRGGIYRRGLIVNCECGLSRYADLDIGDLKALDQRVAAFTVGEAATATLVSDADPDDDFYFVFRNFGEHFRLCMIPLDNATAFLPPGVDGQYTPLKFYSLSRRLIATTIKKIVELFEADPRLRSATYDICFGHAASEKAREVIGRRLGLPQDMYYRTHARYGNTVSASVPLGISLAREEGRLRRGDRTLIIVGSAGISVGLASFTF